jgi:hypothetical protein
VGGVNGSPLEFIVHDILAPLVVELIVTGAVVAPEQTVESGIEKESLGVGLTTTLIMKD